MGPKPLKPMAELTSRLLCRVDGGDCVYIGSEEILWGGLHFVAYMHSIAYEYRINVSRG